MQFASIFERVIVVLAWAVLVIYHLNLFFKVKRQPLASPTMPAAGESIEHKPKITSIGRKNDGPFKKHP